MMLRDNYYVVAYLTGILFVVSPVWAKDIALPDCDFVVEMPASATVERIQSQYITFYQAKATAGRAFLQVECLPYKSNQEEVRAMALSHLNAIGGFGSAFKVSSPDGYEHRFYKKLPEGVVTYVAKIYVGNKSTFIATGGVLSSDFPSDVIAGFHKSIRRQQ